MDPIRSMAWALFCCYRDAVVEAALSDAAETAPL